MQDQKYFDIVAEELLNGPRHPGLWARAFADAKGDEQRAEALYIKYRVTELKELETAAIPPEVKKKATKRATTMFVIAGILGIFVLSGLADGSIESLVIFGPIAAFLIWRGTKALKAN